MERAVSAPACRPITALPGRPARPPPRCAPHLYDLNSAPRPSCRTMVRRQSRGPRYGLCATWGGGRGECVDGMWMGGRKCVWRVTAGERVCAGVTLSEECPAPLSRRDPTANNAPPASPASPRAAPAKPPRRHPWRRHPRVTCSRCFTTSAGVIAASLMSVATAPAAPAARGWCPSRSPPKLRLAAS